jgi:hypothetical protein
VRSLAFRSAVTLITSVYRARQTRVDDLFDDLDDIQDRPPAGQAVNSANKETTFDPLARWNAGDGEGGEGATGEVKKPRRPRAKLDEDRLLGPNGFPRLRDDLKRFKVKGKGKEVRPVGSLLPAS